MHNKYYHALMHVPLRNAHSRQHWTQETREDKGGFATVTEKVMAFTQTEVRQSTWPFHDVHSAPTQCNVTGLQLSLSSEISQEMNLCGDFVMTCGTLLPQNELAYQ